MQKCRIYFPFLLDNIVKVCYNFKEIILKYRMLKNFYGGSSL